MLLYYFITDTLFMKNRSDNLNLLIFIHVSMEYLYSLYPHLFLYTYNKSDLQKVTPLVVTSYPMCLYISFCYNFTQQTIIVHYHNDSAV